MTKTQFHNYVHEFYGPRGIYPMGATMPQIKKATNTHIATATIEVAYDSVDRERVRDILIRDFGLQMPPAPLRVDLLAFQ
jgi:hypothetical protein